MTCNKLSFMRSGRPACRQRASRQHTCSNTSVSRLLQHKKKAGTPLEGAGCTTFGSPSKFSEDRRETSDCIVTFTLRAAKASQLDADGHAPAMRLPYLRIKANGALPAAGLSVAGEDVTLMGKSRESESETRLQL